MAIEYWTYKLHILGDGSRPYRHQPIDELPDPVSDI